PGSSPSPTAPRAAPRGATRAMEPLPGARAGLDERVEEHAVGVAREQLELALHAVDVVLRDLVRREQRRRARQQELAPERDELGALGGRAVVEVVRLDLGHDVAEA